VGLGKEDVQNTSMGMDSKEGEADTSLSLVGLELMLSHFSPFSGKFCLGTGGEEKDLLRGSGFTNSENHAGSMSFFK